MLPRAIRLFVAAVLALGLQIGPARSQPTRAVADGPGVIAFGHLGRVFRINPDGTGFAQVWSDQTDLINWVQGLTWVPGTDYITFVHERDDESGRQLHNVLADGTGHSVWVVDDGSNEPLTGFTYVRAAPDGKSVLTYMNACLPNCEFTDGPAIFDISELSGADITDTIVWPFRSAIGLPDHIPLELYLTNVAPGYHPAGDRVAVSVGECTDQDPDGTPPTCTLGNSALQSWGLNSVFPQPIVTESGMPSLATHEIIAVDWSPDGSRLAFVVLDPSAAVPHFSDGSSTVWVVNSDGTGLAQVTQPQQDFRIGTGVAWSPDGTEILFSGSGHVGLYTIRPDGTGLTTVLSNMESQWFDWACPASGCGEELDEDNDGVSDSSDSCPSVAEDLDGNQDADGCPETSATDIGISAFRVSGGKAGAAPRGIALKLQNRGTAPVTAYFEVTGSAAYTGCSGVTPVIQPGKSYTVAGCTVSYPAAGTYQHEARVFVESVNPADPTQFSDNDLSDNAAVDTTKAR